MELMSSQSSIPQNGPNRSELDRITGCTQPLCTRTHRLVELHGHRLPFSIQSRERLPGGMNLQQKVKTRFTKTSGNTEPHRTRTEPTLETRATKHTALLMCCCSIEQLTLGFGTSMIPAIFPPQTRDWRSWAREAWDSLFLDTGR